MDQSVRDALDANILTPLANSPGGAMLVVIGHSARHDAAATHQKSLVVESDASNGRAKSAQEAVLRMLGEKVGSDASAWAEFPHLETLMVACGATNRVDESGTEEGRFLNRRVELRVCRFLTD
nr:hypothetical protein [Actinomycetales bacterium]